MMTRRRTLKMRNRPSQLAFHIQTACGYVSSTYEALTLCAHQGFQRPAASSTRVAADTQLPTGPQTTPRMPPKHGFLLLCVFLCFSAINRAAPQVNRSVEGQPPAAAAPAAPQAPPASDPSSSPECQARLQQLDISSSLPVVIIQLMNTEQVVGATAAQLQLQDKGPHMPGLMTTCGGPSGSDVVDQPMRMRVRGQSSAREYAKKSFSHAPVDQIANISTWDAKNLAFLGLPRDKDWVLHGPENDRTLGMRNWLGYNMARWMGRYASRTQYFELFLNTDPSTPLSAQHYHGVYMLQEQTERGRERVNIKSFDADEDMSGGYLLAYENDNIDGDDTVFTTRETNMTIVLEYPEKDKLGQDGEKAVSWIQQWMDDFEANLMSQPVANLSTWLDVPAAIDYFIITEITKNPDGYRGSVKMHKDRGGPLVMGPIWDLNEAFGLCCGFPIDGWQRGGESSGSSGGSAITPAGWRFNICQDPGRCKEEPHDGTSQWYRRLWQDAGFRTAAAARWAELRATPNGALQDQDIVSNVTSLKQLLGTGSDTAGQRNFDRWKDALNMPKYGDQQYNEWAPMFEAETEALLTWTLARMKWLDAAFAAQSLPTAGPDAYLSVAFDRVTEERGAAGPAVEGPITGRPAVSGK